MSIEVRRVDGPAFARESARLLTVSWPPPALRYTPELMDWHLSSPGPCELPAVAAFDGEQAVGFAATAARRVRHGDAVTDALLVSFVAVDPMYQRRGIAASLYAHLLTAARATGLPIFTFARAGSAGENALLKAYGAANLPLQAAAGYPVFGCAIRSNESAAEWVPTGTAAIAAAVEACASDTGIIWSDPSPEQLAHWDRQPRPHILLAVADSSGRTAGAAWVHAAEYDSGRGIHSVITIDTLWLPRDRADLLRPLAIAATRAFHDSPAVCVVHAPNLLGFDPAALRQAGFRAVGATFNGYVAANRIAPFTATSGSNMDVQ